MDFLERLILTDFILFVVLSIFAGSESITSNTVKVIIGGSYILSIAVFIVLVLVWIWSD